MCHVLAEKNPPPWLCVESGCDTHMPQTIKKKPPSWACVEIVCYIFTDFYIPRPVFFDKGV